MLFESSLAYLKRVYKFVNQEVYCYFFIYRCSRVRQAIVNTIISRHVPQIQPLNIFSIV